MFYCICYQQVILHRVFCLYRNNFRYNFINSDVAILEEIKIIFTRKFPEFYLLEKFNNKKVIHMKPLIFIGYIYMNESLFIC